MNLTMRLYQILIGMDKFNFRIISCISDQDLHEPSFNKIKNRKRDSMDSNSLGLEILATYSQFWDNERKILDLEALKLKSDEFNGPTE